MEPCQTYKVIYNIIAIITARPATIIPASFNPILFLAKMTMINATAGNDMYQNLKKSIIPNTKVTIQRDSCSIKIL